MGLGDLLGVRRVGRCRCRANFRKIGPDPGNALKSDAARVDDFDRW
jgi:hypothetical protein